MSLSIGIVGLPNVGKSTLFNALTKQSVPAQNYPFCTIDPSVGVVAVPDQRLYKLADFSKSKKVIPAAVEFVDIAGLVKGASTGEGLGNKFLSHIRETDAIAQVVRIFEDDKQIHVHGKVDPLFDIEVINMELIQADIETTKKRIENVSRDSKRGNNEEVVKKHAALEKTLAILESGKLVSLAGLTDDEKEYIRDAHLITAKPILFVLNKKAGGKNLDEMGDERFTKLITYITESGAEYVIVDAKIEDDLKDFEGDERTMFAAELGHNGGDGIAGLISGGYKLLGLEVYFTTGPEETRAWTIKRGSTAPVAAAAIHTDFQTKFIRAEVVFWSDLLDAGSFAEARARGKVRTEGKEYIVKDGDTIEFKI
jgi:ribosome-binding ATPase